MRVPPDQLCRFTLQDVTEREFPLLLRYRRLQNHVQKKIPQLVAEMFHVPTVEGLHDFVGLFNEAVP